MPLPLVVKPRDGCGGRGRTVGRRAWGIGAAHGAVRRGTRATVIEVNPRLTTSYVGLRRSIRENLAGLILDAAAGRGLPEHVTPTGRCRFRADGSTTMLTQAPSGGCAMGPGTRVGTRREGWAITSAGTSAAFTSSSRN